MEEILMALFGGGIADWNDIAKTKYDWEYIFLRIKDDQYGEINIGEININDIYNQILILAREELLEEIEDYCCAANTKEELILTEKLKDISEEDFEIWCNCLDTHIIFLGTIEQADIINKLFKSKIDEIDEKIGFTYLQIEGQ